MPTLICPTPEQLAGLLQEELPLPLRDTLEQHIGECSICQEKLQSESEIVGWRRLIEDPVGNSEPSSLISTQRFLGEATDSLARNEVQSWPGIPDFEPLRELGRGGGGVVYAAKQKTLGRIVAVKILPESANHLPERRLRFRSEAKLVAQLQHPGIVQVYDSGEANGQAWIAQEYCDGGNLSERINHTPQESQDAAQLVRQLAIAVHYAHQNGIIHRDIKPANVLFSGDVPKLADFGLARLVNASSGVTQTSDIMGTPSYMAPEQATARHEEIGPRTDLYGLGAVLYEMLTGIPPFRGATPVETLKQVLEQDPVAPRRLQPAVPRDLEVICLKCLEKQPQQRYASVADFADDLQRFLEGRVVEARPTPWHGRLVRWTKRRPAAAGLILVSLSAIVILLMVWANFTVELNASYGQLSQANQDLNLKTEQLKQSTETAQNSEAQAQRNLKHQVEANEALGEVLQFFSTDLFDAANPEREGVGLTVLEVLDQSEAKIAKRVANRPRVEAALRAAVGNTLRMIGQPLRALPHLERSDALYEQLDDEAEQSAAYDVRHSLARCLQDLSQRSRSQKLLENLASERWQPTDLQRLRLKLDLYAYESKGRALEDNVDAINALHDECRDVLGPDDLITLATLSKLAETYYRAGDYEQALRVYEQEYQDTLKAHGPNHPQTYNAANDKAVVLVRLTRYAEVEEIQRENLRLKLQYLGPRDTSTMGTKHNLSMILWRQNKRQEAIDILREVLIEKKTALGPTDRRTMDSLYQVGRMYLEEKQYAPGLECFQQHFQPYTDSARPTIPWVDLLTVNGQLAVGAGDPDVAAPSLSKARELLSKLGEGHKFQHAQLKTAEAKLKKLREKKAR